MTDDQTKALSLVAAYRFGAEHNLGREVDEIRSMAIDAFGDASPVRRGHVAHLFREGALLDPFIEKTLGVWPDCRGAEEAGLLRAPQAEAPRAPWGRR